MHLNTKILADGTSLLEKDEILRPLIWQCAPQLVPGDGEVMTYLIRSVISQQLSTRAAQTIYTRFSQSLGESASWKNQIPLLPDQTLRACGLSQAKTRYVRAIVAAFAEKRLDNLPWQNLSDEAIFEHLLPIPGVGKWTVEMVLIFCLNREDILPVDDLVIRQQMVSLYKLTATGKALRHQLLQVGEAWRPYRTLASRYLWAWNDQSRQIKNQPVNL